MNIIILGCKDYPAFKYAKDVGGIEVFCDSLLDNLDHEFYVLTRKYNDALKEEKINNVMIYRMGFLNLPLFKTLTFNFFAFFKALKIRTDLIWAHEPVAGFFAYFLSRFKNVPYILHIHSNGSLEPGDFFRRRGLKLMEYFAYKNPTKIIYVSKNLILDIGKNGIVIPVGVDANEFKKAKQLDLIKNIKEKRLCFIGRLDYVKGVQYLLKAFCELKREDLKLLIVGEGRLRKQLEELSNKLKISKNVTFLGYQNSKNVMPYIDIFILPSLSEGLPHTILEALVCNKTIVASDVGEIRDLVDKKYLVKAGDINGLKNKIELALKENKKTKLKDEYKIENVVKKINDVLRQFDKD